MKGMYKVSVERNPTMDFSEEVDGGDDKLNREQGKGDWRAQGAIDY